MTVSQAVASWQIQPFRRGTADCCAFADHVIRETTGKSYLSFEYSDDEGAASIIERFGGLSGAVTHAMKRAPVAAHELQAGDVALVTILEHEAVGIVMPSGKVATLFEDGIIRLVSAGFIDRGWHAWA